MNKWIPLIVGVVTAVLAGSFGIIGIIITHRLDQETQAQNSNLKIPHLHQQYVGDTVNSGFHNYFSLDEINENLTTGDFTASGTFNKCSAQVSGVVTVANEIFLMQINKPISKLAVHQLGMTSKEK